MISWNFTDNDVKEMSAQIIISNHLSTKQIKNGLEVLPKEKRSLTRIDIKASWFMGLCIAWFEQEPSTACSGLFNPKNPLAEWHSTRMYWMGCNALFKVLQPFSSMALNMLTFRSSVHGWSTVARAATFRFVNVTRFWNGKNMVARSDNR